MTRCSAVGNPAKIRRELEALIEATGADEIIVTAQIFDHTARLRSFEIAAEIFEEINTARPVRAKNAESDHLARK